MVVKNKGEKKKKTKNPPKSSKIQLLPKKRKRPITEEIKLKASAQTSMKFQPFLAEQRNGNNLELNLNKPDSCQ